MIENAREYLEKKFEIAKFCLENTVEYNHNYERLSPDSTTNEEFRTWMKNYENARSNIWRPLLDFQKNYPVEPNYYIKKGSSYARVFFVPGLEDVNFIITNEKIPKRFIRNQLKRDPWSTIITHDFISRYTILHLLWITSVMRTRDPGDTKEFDDPFKNFQYPDFIPKCKHCGRHFNKRYPNQRYCDVCRETVKKCGFNPLTDSDKHKYCLNCGKHLPNNKNKKAKFCIGACRVAYFRKKKNNKTEDSDRNVPHATEKIPPEE